MLRSLVLVCDPRSKMRTPISGRPSGPFPVVSCASRPCECAVWFCNPPTASSHSHAVNGPPSSRAQRQSHPGTAQTLCPLNHSAACDPWLICQQPLQTVTKSCIRPCAARTLVAFEGSSCRFALLALGSGDFVALTTGFLALTEPPFPWASGIPSHIIQITHLGICRPHLGQTVPDLTSPKMEVRCDLPNAVGSELFVGIFPGFLSRAWSQVLHRRETCRGAGARSGFLPLS